MVNDAEYVKQTRYGNVGLTVILSLDTYLINILYGGKLLSSFEMCLGYMPSIIGLLKTKLSAELVKFHQAQLDMRAIAILRNSCNQQTFSLFDFKKDEEFLYFKRGPKFGTWEKVLVRVGTDQFIALSSSPTDLGKHARAS